MSLPLALTQALMRLRPSSTRSAESLRAAIADRGGPAPVTDNLRKVARIRETTVAGHTVVHVLPRTPSSANHLIYLHGGCYTFPIGALHWNLLASLVARTGIGVTVPLYGLAPEHTAVEAYDLLDAVWDGIHAPHGTADRSPGTARVFLAGDSAGGGLALGQALRLRDAGASQPAGILLISPWLDATMQNPGVAPVEPFDHMLSAAGLVEAGRLWAGELDTRDPRVSPIFGELGGLPPLYTYQGSNDVFLADTKLLTTRIRAAGGRAELRITQGGFHDFPLVPWVPEGRRSVRRMAVVLAS